MGALAVRSSAAEMGIGTCNVISMVGKEQTETDLYIGQFKGKLYEVRIFIIIILFMTPSIAKYIVCIYAYTLSHQAQFGPIDSHYIYIFLIL